MAVVLALVPGTGGIMMIDAEQRDERTTTQADGKVTCCAPYQSHGQSVSLDPGHWQLLRTAARQKILVGESKAIGLLTCTLDVLKRETEMVYVTAE
jgi:hypothetical protein